MTGKQIAIAGFACYALGAVATAVIVSRGSSESKDAVKVSALAASCGLYTGIIGLGLWAFGK